ncbi:MAG: DUF433 domain-containing protein [Phormidesmis sp.]
MSKAEILDDFPDLTREDLRACIAYAEVSFTSPAVGLRRSACNRIDAGR